MLPFALLIFSGGKLALLFDILAIWALGILAGYAVKRCAPDGLLAQATLVVLFFVVLFLTVNDLAPGAVGL